MTTDDLERRLQLLGDAVAPREALAGPVLRRLAGVPPPARRPRGNLLAAAAALAAAAVAAFLFFNLSWEGPAEGPGLVQKAPKDTPRRDTARAPAVFFSLKDLAFVNSKWGFIDRAGKVVVEPVYTAAQDFAGGLAAVKTGGTHFQGGKWGYVNRAGKVVVAPQFDAAKPFSERLAAVHSGGRWGYIDRAGKVIVPPRFEQAGPFSEGVAAVQSGGKWGYIDPAGKWRIEPSFTDAGRFSDGLAAVSEGGKYGYIDRAGKVVIEPRFDYAAPFSEGRAAFRVGDHYGYIDRGGRVAVPAQYARVEPFAGGRARVWRQVELKFPELRRVLRDEQAAAIDPVGKVVEPFVSPYTYGLVYDAREGKVKAVHEKVWDGSGETVTDFPIDPARVRFQDGMAHVRTGIGMEARHGFIDREGKLAIPPRFEWAEDFEGGLARFAVGVDWKAARQPTGHRAPGR